MGELENKSVIAMKGHSFTKKTEFAKLIAVSLNCPVLSLDDILDSLNPDHSQPSYAVRLHDVAFGIMIKIAKSNFSAGVFRQVVIDSPLSSRSQLDHLIDLANSLELPRLVIVECKPDNLYSWRINFEEYLDRNPDEKKKWYKPKRWEDVEKAIHQGYDYDERLDVKKNGLRCSKLVLDPIRDNVRSSVSSARLPPFIDAVKHMINREEDDPDIIVYQRWRQGQYLDYAEFDSNPCFSDEEFGGQIGFLRFDAQVERHAREQGSCRAGSGHYITNYENETEKDGKTETECTACETRVVGAAAYTCKYCSFTLHKECAEFPDCFLPPEPSIGTIGMQYSEHFKNLERFPCKKKHSFDSSCGDCLFKTHLKNRRMPTVIRHECDVHFLSIVLSFLNPHEELYQCTACGEPVNVLWYSCKICCVAYHYKCLVTFPRLVDNEHGLHHHHMALQYSSEEAEDYLCLICFDNKAPERRDPSRWFYSCQDCEYYSHVQCVYYGPRRDGYFTSVQLAGSREWNKEELYSKILQRLWKSKEEDERLFEIRLDQIYSYFLRF